MLRPYFPLLQNRAVPWGLLPSQGEEQKLALLCTSLPAGLAAVLRTETSLPRLWTSAHPPLMQGRS